MLFSCVDDLNAEISKEEFSGSVAVDSWFCELWLLVTVRSNSQ